MKGLNQKQIIEKAKKDVTEIGKDAAILMELSDDNKIVRIERNSESQLNVIAVVGPIKLFSGKADDSVIAVTRDLDRGLLAEIGIGATYPYHKARRLRRRLGQSYEIASRQKWFTLTSEQYQYVAPVIFWVIERLAFQKVIKWKWGQYGDGSYSYQFLRKFWSKKKKKFIEIKSPYKIAEKGIRFSVSLEDRFFLQDIFWAEMNLNAELKNRIKRCLNSIDLVANKSQGDFESVQKAIKISKLSSHLLIEVLRQLRDKKKSKYWRPIAKMIGCDVQEKKSEEENPIRSILPNFESRLQNIRLQITTSLDKSKDYIVFEVLPRDFREEK